MFTIKTSIEMIKRNGIKCIIVAALTFFGIVYGSIQGYAQQETGIIEQLQQKHSYMGNISIKQDPSITQLLNAYYIQNASRPGMQGFRIRIFFDLGQQSRNNSQIVMDEFMESNPSFPVYRTFDSPYYKVSIGDYRSRDEALKDLKRFGRKYPKAFVVPEWINFPRIN